MNLLLSVLLPVLKNINAVRSNNMVIIGYGFFLIIGVVIIVLSILAVRNLRRIHKENHKNDD